MKILARRSKRAKKFLRDMCSITVHQYNEDTYRCGRCNKHAGENIMVFVNGLLNMPLKDYNVRLIKSINKIVFIHPIDPGNTVHIRYEEGGRVVLTTHQPSYSRKDFTFRKVD